MSSSQVSHPVEKKKIEFSYTKRICVFFCALHLISEYSFFETKIRNFIIQYAYVKE